MGDIYLKIVLMPVIQYLIRQQLLLMHRIDIFTSLMATQITTTSTSIGVGAVVVMVGLPLTIWYPTILQTTQNHIEHTLM